MAARAKGVPERGVIWRHALRAAMVSIIPVLGIQAGFVLSGAVYIEMVFQWPGVGRMLVDAILKRDILLVQGGVVFVAACYVLFNIVVDVAQSLLDPRIKTWAFSRFSPATVWRWPGSLSWRWWCCWRW